MPTIFEKLVEWRKISTQEAHRIFTIGIGLVLVVDATYEARIRALLPEIVSIECHYQTRGSCRICAPCRGFYIHDWYRP